MVPSYTPGSFSNPIRVSSPVGIPTSSSQLCTCGIWSLSTVKWLEDRNKKNKLKISTFLLEEDSFQAQCFTSCKPPEITVREQVSLQMSLEPCNENLQWYFFSSPRTRSFFSSSVHQSKPGRKLSTLLKLYEIVNSQLLRNKLKKWETNCPAS